MKKIFKASTWDQSEQFTSLNVQDKTHWWIKLLDTALSQMDIGTYAFGFVDHVNVTLSTVRYGNFTLSRPTVGDPSTYPYVLYANSETKELWGGTYQSQSAGVNKVVDTTLSSHTINVGVVIGPVIRNVSGSSGSINAVVQGGWLALKFTGTDIVGTSWSGTTTKISSATSGYSMAIMPTSLGSVIGERYKSLSAPITPVGISYARKPILDHGFVLPSSTFADTDVVFNGQYFESIYESKQYYQGALIDTEKSLFCFAGCVFDVDDPTNITIV